MVTLSRHRRRLIGRLVLAGVLAIVFSIGLFENRAWLIPRLAPDAGPAAPGQAPAADAPETYGRVPRRHPDEPIAAARVAAAPRSARAPAPPPAELPPGGLRQRLIPSPAALFDAERPFAPPPLDTSLFAMAARPPLLASPYDPGLAYRLGDDRRFFRPVRSLALNDRLPLVWMRAGPVPEPASWALMIVGLGLVGTALRRRGTGTPQPDPAG